MTDILYLMSFWLNNNLMHKHYSATDGTAFKIKFQELTFKKRKFNALKNNITQRYYVKLRANKIKS